MNKKTIKDIDIKGKRVLIRVDFNVPFEKGTTKISDDTRIVGALPTIKYAIEKGAKVVLMSHLGRPDGMVKEELRLAPVAKRLSELLERPVIAAKDCIGEEVKKQVASMKNGDVILLENLRFHKEEEENDPNFAKELSLLGDVYVNDAFGTAHRAHASTEGVTKYLPGVAGFLIEKEIEYLGNALNNPKRPFVAILGGAKVSDKIGVINNLWGKVDKIIVGGAMAYTFMKATGQNVGASKVEADKLDIAKNILEEAKKRNVELLLPVDHIMADKFDKNANTEISSGVNIKDGWLGLDIGPKTVKLFSDALVGAKTVVWNGPMGVFEMDKFDKGSLGVAQAVVNSKAVSIIGGGDTASCIAKFGLTDKMSHISTGGGASLEYMEGRVLPGIAALQDK